MDVLKEAVALVHKAIEHGGSTDAKAIAAALETIGATLVGMSKGVKPVAACSAAEYQEAIKRGNVLCLECGEEVQALGSHVMKAHAMGWGDYMDRWGWWFEREGLTPRKAGATLSARRRDNAIMIGLGAQGQQPKKAAPVKSEWVGGAPVKAGLKRMTKKQMYACPLPVLMDYCNALEEEAGTNAEWAEACDIHCERNIGVAPIKSEEERQAEIEAFDRAINLK